jgi:hypothetical protein
MTADRLWPQRHWRSYGADPLRTPAEALGEPLRAFPSWFLRIRMRALRCDADDLGASFAAERTHHPPDHQTDAP